MNLDALKFSRTAIHNVRHPLTGVDTGWIITLAGPGHPQVLEFEEAEFRRGQDEQETRSREDQAAIDAGREPPLRRQTRAEVRRRRAEKVAAHIITSTPATLNGQDTTLTRDNAATILADPDLDWLLNQLTSTIQGRAVFISGSAPAS